MSVRILPCQRRSGVIDQILFCLLSAISLHKLLTFAVKRQSLLKDERSDVNECSDVNVCSEAHKCSDVNECNDDDTEITNDSCL